MNFVKRLPPLLIGLSLTLPLSVRGDRLRDIVEVVGARSNQLVGYGIVVGLSGTLILLKTNSLALL